MIDFVAFEQHFADHLAPIYDVLQEMGEAGDFYCARGMKVPAPAPKARPGKLPATAGLYVVASMGDLWRTPMGSTHILVEHGAGQTYSTSRHHSYSGGEQRESVRLFLSPGEQPCRRNREMYPDARVMAIGSPKMDVWHVAEPKPMPSEPVIAITFHFESRVVPETRSAWSAYRHALPWLSEQFQVIGHAHPRMAETIVRYYKQWDIEYVSDLADVFERADVLLVDNSSAGWEFLSLDRPVVWLNAPWYRRDVEHGMRFWELADSGVQVEERIELVPAVERAIEDPPEQQARRRRAVEKVYAYRDGKASLRAAEAILEVATGG